MARCASMLAADRERVVGVALGPLRLTLRERHGRRASVSANISHQPVAVVTVSSARRRAATESPPANAACAFNAAGIAGTTPGCCRPSRSRPAPSQHRRRPGRESNAE